MKVDRQQLQAELDKALLELEDNEQLRSGFLGQTGVHIGARMLRAAQGHFDREEARLRERIAVLRKLLATCDGVVGEGSQVAKD